MVPLLVVGVVVLALILWCLSLRIVQQDEQGVLFRLGGVIGDKAGRADPDHPGRRRPAQGQSRIVVMPIQSEGTPAATSASTSPRSPITVSSTL